jgi:DNA-directed RNA polymerase subunit E'/Rpb7
MVFMMDSFSLTRNQELFSTSGEFDVTQQVRARILASISAIPNRKMPDRKIKTGDGSLYFSVRHFSVWYFGGKGDPKSGQIAGRLNRQPHLKSRHSRTYAVGREWHAAW